MLRRLFQKVDLLKNLQHIGLADVYGADGGQDRCSGHREPNDRCLSEATQ